MKLIPLYLFLLALVCSDLDPSRVDTWEPPNFVILFSDDAGYADFGFQGSTEIRTPNLDRLATSGVRFTNGYVTASVCSPSRAGMLTGRYQQRFGHELNLPGQRDPSVPNSLRGLPLSEKTVADLLKNEGYVTGLVGKWHLGLEDRFHPTNRGFDEFFGLRKGSGPYIEGSVNTIEKDWESVPPDSLIYLTDEFGNRAVDFISRHQDQPFFLFLSFTAPHTPMEAKPEYLALESNRFNTEVRAKNAAMTHSLDDNIGKVLAALSDLGLREKTLVVFANDNGGAMPYNGSLNAPLRGAKGTALEGGNRVPYLMSWPGTLPEGVVYDFPVSTLDILPTFLENAGASLQNDGTYDGVDLVPYLTGSNLTAPHDTLYWKMQWGAAIRVHDWKLVRTPSNEHWLFNLKEDVSESRNLASAFPTRLGELKAALEQWESGLPAPIWTIDEGWHARTLERYDQSVVDGFIRR